jgi:hypothetical protein
MEANQTQIEDEEQPDILRSLTFLVPATPGCPAHEIRFFYMTKESYLEGLKSDRLVRRWGPEDEDSIPVF